MPSPGEQPTPSPKDEPEVGAEWSGFAQMAEANRPEGELIGAHADPADVVAPDEPDLPIHDAKAQEIASVAVGFGEGLGQNDADKRASLGAAFAGAVNRNLAVKQSATEATGNAADVGSAQAETPSVPASPDVVRHSAREAAKELSEAVNPPPKGTLPGYRPVVNPDFGKGTDDYPGSPGDRKN